MRLCLIAETCHKHRDASESPFFIISEWTSLPWVMAMIYYSIYKLNMYTKRVTFPTYINAFTKSV